MNTQATGKWARRAVWGTLVAVMTIGCNPLTTIGFLLHKDDIRPAEYPMVAHKDAQGKDKDEVKLVILCDMPGNGTEQYVGSDRELAAIMAKRFPELLKENGSKIKLTVVSSSQVDKFTKGHRGWKTMPPREIGRSLGADYLMFVTLTGMQMYEPASANQIYRGRVEANVDVYDTTVKGNEPKFSYPYAHVYPKTGVRDAGSVPVSLFKKEFMTSLANTLILKHVEHKQSVGIASDD